jgi:RNA polymerase sigma-70 factor (ECF subfamily)
VGVDQRSDEDLLVVMWQDPGAFAEFYRRHVDKVLGFALRRMRSPEDVADLVASVFVQVIESARRFDPARGRAVPWLLGVAANTLSAERRRRARAEGTVRRLVGRRYLSPDDHDRVEERLDAAAQARRAHEALAGLPDGEREAVELVVVDGLTPGEAAEALGLSATAVRSRLARARRKLRGALGPAGPIVPAMHAKEIQA